MYQLDKRIYIQILGVKGIKSSPTLKSPLPQKYPLEISLPQ